MTRTEKSKRRAKVLKDFDRGIPRKELAEKYGLSLSYIYQMCPWSSDRPTFETPKRKPETPAKEQEQNRTEAEEKWTVWRKEHIRTCEDVEGECCAACHARLLLSHCLAWVQFNYPHL